ncbi:MAG: hypothetical protein ABIR28_04890 [Vicinamibacteria bacterium]
MNRSIAVGALMAGLITSPSWAHTPKPSPVGKVNTARYESLMNAGNNLEASWTAGANLDEVRSQIMSLDAELLRVKDVDITEADRLFVRAMGSSSWVFHAGTLIWEGSEDASKRPQAEADAQRFGVETILWATRDKYAIVMDDAAAFLLAANHYYAGRIGRGLAVESQLFGNIAARKQAGLKRKMTSGEANSIYLRLYSHDSEERRGAALDAAVFGSAAAPFAERLRELSLNEDPATRTAASAALARIAEN